MSFNNSMILSHLNGWSASSIIPGGMIPDSFLFYWQCSICVGIQCHQWRCLTLSIKYFPSQLVHASPTLLYRYLLVGFTGTKMRRLAPMLETQIPWVVALLLALSSIATYSPLVQPTHPLLPLVSVERVERIVPHVSSLFMTPLLSRLAWHHGLWSFQCVLWQSQLPKDFFAGITFHHRTNVILRLETVSTIDCSGINPLVDKCTAHSVVVSAPAVESINQSIAWNAPSYYRTSSNASSLWGASNRRGRNWLHSMARTNAFNETAFRLISCVQSKHQSLLWRRGKAYCGGAAASSRVWVMCIVVLMKDDTVKCISTEQVQYSTTIIWDRMTIWSDIRCIFQTETANIVHIEVVNILFGT